MVKSFIGYVLLRVLPGKSVSYHGAVRMVVAFLSSSSSGRRLSTYSDLSISLSISKDLKKQGNEFHSI